MPSTRGGGTTGDHPKPDLDASVSRRRTRSGGGEATGEVTLPDVKGNQTRKSSENTDKKIAGYSVAKSAPRGKTAGTPRAAMLKGRESVATPPASKQEADKTPTRAMRGNQKQTMTKSSIVTDVHVPSARLSRSQSIKSTEAVTMAVSASKGNAKSKQSDEWADSTPKTTSARATRQHKGESEDDVQETPTRSGLRRGRPKSVDSRTEKKNASRKSDTKGESKAKNSSESAEAEVIGSVIMSCEEEKPASRSPSVTSSIEESGGSKERDESTGTAPTLAGDLEASKIDSIDEASQRKEAMSTEPSVETSPSSTCTIGTQTPILAKGKKRQATSKDSESTPKKVRPDHSFQPARSADPGAGSSTPAAQTQIMASPRKSSRQSKPNRRYADMEVEFGKKKSIDSNQKTQVGVKMAVHAVPISTVLDNIESAAALVTIQPATESTESPMEVAEKDSGKKSAQHDVQTALKGQPEAPAEPQEIQVSAELPSQESSEIHSSVEVPSGSPKIQSSKEVAPKSHEIHISREVTVEAVEIETSVEGPQDPQTIQESAEVVQVSPTIQISPEVPQEPQETQGSTVPQEPPENQASVETPQEFEVESGQPRMIQTVVLEFKSSGAQTDVGTQQDEESASEEGIVSESSNAQTIPVEVSDGVTVNAVGEPSIYKNLTYTTVTMPADQALGTDPPPPAIIKVHSVTGAQETSKKTQEYVIVHLPEGATVQQKDVGTKARSKEDDTRCEVDEETGLFKCMDCNYLTSKKTNWYKHKRKHMGVRPYVCSICNYKSTTGSNLKRHMAIHKDIRTHECTTCGLMFRQKIHLERHQKYKHEEKSVKCPMCDYVCANENPDLKIHIKRRHVKEPAGAGFNCSECNLVILSRRDFKQHMKFHRKGPELKLFCEHCSFVTDCESRLNRHVLIHSKLKPFKCGLCEYRGSQKEHVLRHMKSQHAIDIPERLSRPSPSETPQDSTEETTENNETSAALIMNEDSLSDSSEPSPEPPSLGADRKYDKADFSCRDKIFACNHCSMKFSKLINLYKHLHTQHRSIMPTSAEEFSCVVCEFRTNTKKNLLVHMRKHNLHDQNPPSHVYSCVLCSYVNPKRRNLFQHMKKKHKIEIVMKDDGSANCFIAENSNVTGSSGEVENENLMTVGDVVTTSTENQLTIAENTSVGNIQRLVSIADLANAISLPHNSEGVVYIEQTSSAKTLTQMDLADLQVESINAQHEAAEAIQGLQALAEQSQRTLLETPVNISIESLQGNALATVQQVELMESTDNVVAEVENVVTGVENVAAEVESQVVEVSNQGDITGLVSAVETVEGTSPAPEDRPSIQLSAEQLMNLSSGDYVEINGEMYKVEFTSEDGTS